MNSIETATLRPDEMLPDPPDAAVQDFRSAVAELSSDMPRRCVEVAGLTCLNHLVNKGIAQKRSCEAA